jgi:formate dehydrogenase subunit gamma
MLKQATNWSRYCLLIGAMLALASGMAWATLYELPAPATLPPAEPAPGWREFMIYREALRWFGGIVLGFMVVVVLSRFAAYGAHRIRPSGRTVVRFNLKEILVHNLLALAFIGAWASSTYLILAKHLLGYAEKGTAVPLGGLSSAVHNTAGILFLIALFALAVMWRQGMRFSNYDRDWLKEVGGYFSRRHRILPAGRFNAGQKIWFYMSIFLGILAAISGALIYYPALLGARWNIVLYVAHTALSVALSAVVVVHVYLSIIVHPLSFWTMITGRVDEAWLRENHPMEPLPQTGHQPT